ncbi:MAG TPA: hypothetical protein VNW52_10940 [Burkholderiaceae bacterium]|jgi:hypothetical protein|nr:hypothetical protein [Burkholderiaceae bacterium]
MRSTRATAAVERLKTRSGNPRYSMLLHSDDMFSLMLASTDGTPAVAQGDALPMDAFVKFVDGFGPQTPRRATKNDLAFEAQLGKRNK